MRIAFATAFAAPGEVPEGLRYSEKCERNFEFIHSLMKQAQADGDPGQALSTAGNWLMGFTAN